MADFLRALGFLTIIAGIVLAFIYSNAQDDINRTLRLMGAGTSTTPPIAIWIYWALGGLISSFLWFALATIISNQERLEYRLSQIQNPPQPQEPKPARRISTGDYTSQTKPTRVQKLPRDGISWPD